MSTSTLNVSTAFTDANALQPSYTSPPTLPALADTRPTQYSAGTLTLAAAGVSALLPVPAGWTSVYSVLLVNTSALGYAVLKLNATSGALDFTLASNSGAFAVTLASIVPSGEVAPTPATWTLRSCDSAGVLASGVSTAVYYYLTGA